jgi:hypothetical protein
MKKNTLRSHNPLLLLTLFALVFATPAYAYIDPNTQGLISQSLTPLFVIGATVLMFFRDKAVNAIQWIGRCLGRRTDGATE